MTSRALTLLTFDRASTTTDWLVSTTGAVLVPATVVAEATGWVRKPEGLCRGEVCIPAALHTGLAPDADRPDLLDLAVVADATEQLVVADLDRGVVALGPSAARRTRDLRTLDASDVVATDLDGDPVRLTDYAGRKKLLVAFSSWCGCRHDLPGWQELQDELAPHGLQVIGVAVDEQADDIRPFVDEAAATFPVILDHDHALVERFDITNVPTVVWIDEDDQVVRPNDVAFGTDAFKDFHGVESGPHHDALRRWVRDGEVPVGDDDAVRAAQVVPSDDQQRARLHHRIGLELHRRGDADGALAHFDRGGELAPDDFTIRRSTMPLRGIDPFLSPEFIALYEEWQAAGAYQYGIDR